MSIQIGDVVRFRAADHINPAFQNMLAEVLNLYSSGEFKITLLQEIISESNVIYPVGTECRASNTDVYYVGQQFNRTFRTLLRR
jgi:hypothetical protein